MSVKSGNKEDTKEIYESIVELESGNVITYMAPLYATPLVKSTTNDNCDMMKVMRKRSSFGGMFMKASYIYFKKCIFYSKIALHSCFYILILRFWSWWRLGRSISSMSYVRRCCSLWMRRFNERLQFLWGYIVSLQVNNIKIRNHFKKIKLKFENIDFKIIFFQFIHII